MLNIFIKVLTVIVKIIIVGVYTFDYTQTRKLLLANKAVRELYWYQKVECFFFFFAAYLQILIPLTIIKPAYSLLIEFILFIFVYIHLNRWLFLGRHVLICRTELFKTARLINPTYEKGILRFRSGNRSFAIHHPLATKELIKKYL